MRTCLRMFSCCLEKNNPLKHAAFIDIIYLFPMVLVVCVSEVVVMALTVAVVIGNFFMSKERLEINTLGVYSTFKMAAVKLTIFGRHLH